MYAKHWNHAGALYRSRIPRHSFMAVGASPPFQKMLLMTFPLLFSLKSLFNIAYNQAELSFALPAGLLIGPLPLLKAAPDLNQGPADQGAKAF